MKKKSFLSKSIVFVLLISMAPKAQCGFWDWVKSFWTPERSQQTAALVQKAGEHKGKVLAAAALLVAGSAVAYRLATKTRREYKRLVEEEVETRRNLFKNRGDRYFDQDYEKNINTGEFDKVLKAVFDSRGWGGRASLKDLFATRLLRFNFSDYKNREEHTKGFLDRFFDGNEFGDKYAYLKNKLKSRVWYEGLLKFDDQWQKEHRDEDAKEELESIYPKMVFKISRAIGFVDDEKELLGYEFKNVFKLLKKDIEKEKASQGNASDLTASIKKGYRKVIQDFAVRLCVLNTRQNEDRAKHTKGILDILFGFPDVEIYFDGDSPIRSRAFYESLLHFDDEVQEEDGPSRGVHKGK